MALTTNLVSYWKLDESSGNAADSVGSNTLTNNGTTAYAAGKINNGADFGSANSTKYFSVADNASLDITGSLTYSCWINVTTQVPTNGNYAFGGKTAGGSNRSWWFDYQDISGTKTIRLNLSANGAVVTTKEVAYTFTTDTWTHVVAVYDTSTATTKFYINGSQQGADQTNSAASIFNSTAAFEIGVIHAGTIYFYSGQIDEVGIWSRALSSTEVSELYNSGAGLQYPFSSFIPQIMMS